MWRPHGIIVAGFLCLSIWVILHDRISGKIITESSSFDTSDAQWLASLPLNQTFIPQCADPFIRYHKPDGHYYFIATVPEYDRIELRRAPKLSELPSAEKLVLWRKKKRGWMSSYVWAPELHYIQGVWYIYFTAGDDSEGINVRMFVLSSVCEIPTEPQCWKEQGRLTSPPNTFALDPTTFVQGETQYLIWSQYKPRFNVKAVLVIAEMATATKINFETSRVISWPVFEWEKRGFRLNEAPAVFVTDEHIYLTYSASATDHNYCVGLLTATRDSDILNPKSWVKSPLPVMMTDEALNIYGPGHLSTFPLHTNGNQSTAPSLGFVYHARTYKTINGNPLNDPNRHTFIRALTFNAQGHPVFA